MFTANHLPTWGCLVSCKTAQTVCHPLQMQTCQSSADICTATAALQVYSASISTCFASCIKPVWARGSAVCAIDLKVCYYICCVQMLKISIIPNSLWQPAAMKGDATDRQQIPSALVDISVSCNNILAPWRKCSLSRYFCSRCCQWVFATGACQSHRKLQLINVRFKRCAMTLLMVTTLMMTV